VLSRRQSRMLPKPDLRAGQLEWPSRQQEAALARGLWVKIDDPLGARLQRGGPTIACPVTAARSEHPKVVLHSNSKKRQPYSTSGSRCSKIAGTL
jgi:hypothetical protein